jgi:rod shape determining protein RodA
MGRALTPRLRETIDWPLVVAVIVLAIVGITNLYSATSATRSELYITQLYWLAFGSGAAAIVAAVDYRYFERYGYFIYAAGLVLLVSVLVLAEPVHGSRRWLSLGPANLQPSELMKLLLVVALAKYLHNDPRTEGRTLRDLLVPGLMTLVPVTLTLVQPDLGTALVITLVFFTLMLMTRLTLRSALTLLLIGAAAFPFSWAYLLRPYQRTRIVTLFNPDADPLGAGWHARQSLVAIGSGRLFGKGFMGSTQNQNHFLPFQNTDFPFPIFCEEHGFVGAVLLLGLFLFLVLRCVRIAEQAKDRFGTVVAMGVASMLFWQVFINLGMVTRLLPVAGVTLPMISYGGSSLFTILLGIGLVLNVSMRRHQTR